ncbi:hypothetical protein CEXT_291981 [Caerostris extrusa]|uniref:Uncharacterized protein n=1 Tax=Caerostris extrusa TaxID=172846 RepID=A0AAV4TQ76_CAEEX|nr:hypothetical protein CEXT_291981 [Caerostris extrusa]
MPRLVFGEAVRGVFGACQSFSERGDDSMRTVNKRLYASNASTIHKFPFPFPAHEPSKPDLIGGKVSDSALFLSLERYEAFDLVQNFVMGT